MSPTQKRGAVQATAGMLLVGTLVAVSARIGDYPVYGGQALRYALGAGALFAVLLVRRSSRRGVRPSGGGGSTHIRPVRGGADGAGSARPPRVRIRPRQWALLATLSASGLVVFNVCIVLATSYASPATIGTIVGSGPIVMAVLGPVMGGGRPAVRVLGAAGVVTLGTAIGTGLGGASLPGVLLALGALAGEVSFSLLAVPLLPTLGALRVSAYSAALAVPLLLVIGAVVDGPAMLRVPSAAEASAFAYLGLVVTAGAFLLWYDALPRLGADRAGLFAGVMPIGAVLTMVVLGIGTPSAAELCGVALVVGGILYGVGFVGRRARVEVSAA